MGNQFTFFLRAAIGLAYVAMGSFMLYRSEVLEEAGLLPQKYIIALGVLCVLYGLFRLYRSWEARNQAGL